MKNATTTLESMSQAVWYNNWTLNKFTPHIGGDILEVGCGIGNFTKLLAEYGRVWAIDINRKYLENLKKGLKEGVCAGYGDIEKGDYFFKEKKFDVIVCLNVLEHIKNDGMALKNLSNLLKPGGKLILLVPAHQFLYGKIDYAIGHFRRYSKTDIENKLKECQFKILSSKRFNFLGGIGWFFAGRMLNANAVGKGNISVFNRIAPLLLPLEFIEPPLGTSVLVIAQK